MISWEEWNSIDMDAFPKLRTLRFHDCPKLIGNLPRRLLSLRNLEIERCPLLASSIPKCSNSFPLGELVIIKSPNVALPRSVTHLTISATQMSAPLFEKMNVVHLIVRDCLDAVPLPLIHIPRSVRRLTILDCENLKFLMSLFDDMKRLQPISKELFIKGCSEPEPFSITLPSSLQRLEIRECDKLLSCLTELHHLPTITQLCIYCRSWIWDCKRLRHLTFQELQILDSPNIEKIEGEIMPPSLQRLHICRYGFLLEQCCHKDIWLDYFSNLEIGTSSEDEDMNDEGVNDTSVLHIGTSSEDEDMNDEGMNDTSSLEIGTSSEDEDMNGEGMNDTSGWEICTSSGDEDMYDDGMDDTSGWEIGTSSKEEDMNDATFQGHFYRLFSKRKHKSRSI